MPHHHENIAVSPNQLPFKPAFHDIADLDRSPEQRLRHEEDLQRRMRSTPAEAEAALRRYEASLMGRKVIETALDATGSNHKNGHL